MKTSLKHLGSLLGALLLLPTTLSADTASPLNAAIPFSEIGAKATADYTGDAIGIKKTADGVTLHTAFQKLSGTVTREGLRLTSTEEGGGSLHLVASAVGRGDSNPHFPALRSVPMALSGASRRKQIPCSQPSSRSRSPGAAFFL